MLTGFQALFTLYQTVKQRVAKGVPNRDSVHIRNAAFEAVSAPQENCSPPLQKVEYSMLDRFMKRCESRLNTFMGAKHAAEPRIG